MIKKFFQHVDGSDKSTFLHVTQLLYIDDTDPYMVLYYFKDESKCNEEFIGTFDKNVTTESINNFAYVQINENQKWNCKIIEHKAQQQTAITAQGEQVIVPDRTMYSIEGKALNDTIQYNWTAPIKRTNSNNTLDIFKVSVLTSFLETGQLPIKVYNPEINTPKELYNLIYDISLILDFIPSYVIPLDLQQKIGKLLSNAEYAAFSHDPEHTIAKEQIVKAKSMATTVYTPKFEEVDNSVEDLTINEPNTTEAKLDIQVPAMGKKIRIYEDGDTTWMVSPIDGKAYEIYELFHALEEVNEQKNVVSADTPNSQPEVHSFLKDVNPETLSFLSNMIANAAKKTAEASVSIELDVPPFDVYKLLKMAYPENWATIFIDIIATSVAPTALQQALGEGLKAYYEDEMSNHQ